MVRDDCKHYQPPSGWCDGDYCELRKDFFTPCDGCENYESKNKRTNAMKIRSMTGEELAELFMQEYDGADSFTCPVPHPCPPEKEASCRECFLDWLKEEVTANDS